MLIFGPFAKFPLLCNRGLGALSVAVLPIPFARRPTATACAAVQSAAAFFVVGDRQGLPFLVAGAAGVSVTYQESASFTQNGGVFVLDLLSSDALGNGFDSALFTISLDSAVFESHSFTDLASAEAFFSNNLIDVPLLPGFNSVQIALSETMSGGEGFSFDYAVASSGVSGVPGPIAGTGPPGLILTSGGLLGWWRRRQKPFA